MLYNPKYIITLTAVTSRRVKFLDMLIAQLKMAEEPKYLTTWADMSAFKRTFRTRNYFSETRQGNWLKNKLAFSG